MIRTPLDTAQAPNVSATAEPRITTNKWLTLLVMAPGVFIGNLDTSIVNISLPTMAQTFGVPLNGLIEWVVIAYLMVIAASVLTFGRLADIVGRKPLWIVGMLVFTIGSALCGLAPTLLWLVIARGFQGLGAAGMMAVGPALLTGAFPAHERGRALGMNAVTVALGISVGPALGGIVVQHLTWHGIFYINIPLGCIGLLLAFWLLHERRVYQPRPVDIPGAIFLAIGLVTLTIGVSFAQEWGWHSWRLPVTLILCLLALGSLIVVESRAAYPIIIPALLRNRRFIAANASLILSMLALFSASVLLPFYLEDVRAFSPAQAGLLLTPLPLTIAICATGAGAIADRLGTRWLAAGGLATACLGLILVSQLKPSSALWEIIGCLIVIGLGQALFQSPNNSALMGAVSPHQQGSAAGFMATSRIVGQSLSVAIAGAIFAATGGARAGLLLAARHGHHTPLTLLANSIQVFFHGFQTTLFTCAGLAVTGAIISLCFTRSE